MAEKRARPPLVGMNEVERSLNAQLLGTAAVVLTGAGKA